jgi:ATP-binding cassette subfamily B protein
MSENPQSAFQLIRQYPRVCKLVWDTSPLYSILAVFLTLCSAVVMPVKIWITKLIIDGIAEILQRPDQALSIDWFAVLMPVATLTLVWGLGLVCQKLSGGIKRLLSIQVRHYTEYLILQKATQLDIAFFESSTFYDQMDMVLREAYRRQ